MRKPPRHLTFGNFWGEFVRVPDERTGSLVHPKPHAEQARFIAAMDAFNADGVPQFTDYVLSWNKKSAKSTTAAATGVWGLTSDTAHADREVTINSTDAEQSDIIFGISSKIVDRHPWLRKHVRVMKREMVYDERVTDHRTGGHYTQSHVLRALPRDVRGLHGLNPSLRIFDEVWAQDDFELIEAISPSPARSILVQCGRAMPA